MKRPSTAPALGQPALVAIALVCLCALWVWVSGRQHTAMHHDMAEQFVWAHAWQWGYPKHPPLPTWLFMAALQWWPAQPATLYGLSALCVAVTGVCTYLSARTLWGDKAGLAVAALWSLQQPFSWRAWIYNHNTVLVMCMALTVVCTLYAVRRGGRGWWLAAGVGAGLALDTKLQAAVPLAGVLWALWRSGALRAAPARAGLAWAMAVAVLLSAVPLWWMLSGHTNGLAYARHQFDGSGHPHERRLLAFVVCELRMLGPALLLWTAWAAWGRPTRQTDPDPVPANALVQRAWLEGLLYMPLLVMLASGLAGRATLHAQWGVQTFQFAALALVAWTQPMIQRLSIRGMALSAAVAQALSLTLAVTPIGARLHAPGAVQGYPAARLSQQVQQDWARWAGGCPLRYVAGPFFEAGQLTAYLPSHPVVLEDGVLAEGSGVSPATVSAAGSVVLAGAPEALPPGVVHEPAMTLAPPEGVKGVGTVYWGIRLPTACQAGATTPVR